MDISWLPTTLNGTFLDPLGSYMDPHAYGLWLDEDISWITLASPSSYGFFMVTHGSSMDYDGPCITPLSFKDSKLAPHGYVMDHYDFRWLHHGLWNVPMVF